MARRGGWRRLGRRRFRYVDSQGRKIEDEEALERIRTLAIPPAWEDVWISPIQGRTHDRGLPPEDERSPGDAPRRPAALLRMLRSKST